MGLLPFLNKEKAIGEGWYCRSALQVAAYLLVRRDSVSTKPACSILATNSSGLNADRTLQHRSVSARPNRLPHAPHFTKRGLTTGASHLTAASAWQSGQSLWSALRRERQAYVGGARCRHLRAAHTPRPGAVPIPVRQTMQHQVLFSRLAHNVLQVIHNKSLHEAQCPGNRALRRARFSHLRATRTWSSPTAHRSGTRTGKSSASHGAQRTMGQPAVDRRRILGRWVSPVSTCSSRGCSAKRVTLLSEEFP